MRMIVKGEEPRSLTQHRLQDNSNYNSYYEKDDLRMALVREQKGLCCYCTNRIRPESTKMKIEHWKCQANYSDLQLDYSNLLGSCHGITDFCKHCDTGKGNQDLIWNPANVTHRIEDRIRYLNDGTIEGISDEFNRQINEILNLNII